VRRATLLLILLCGVTFLAGLGRPAIGDSDEAFYAEAAREMVEGGDWLTPHYNYEPRFQKPILFYWLIASSYSVAGIGEAQARFVAAVSGLGLSLLVLAAGRRWYDEHTGFIAGAIVATSFGYFSIGRLALPDLPLAFFVTVTIVAALAGTVDDDRRPSRWLLLAGAAAGCAFLTKGPVGVVVSALVLVPVWILERHHVQLPIRAAVGAVALAMAIGMPWYVAMTLAHGQTYLNSFFVADNLQRFATSRFNDPRPLWFYLPIVAGGLLPWTPLAVVALPRMFARSRARPWMTPLTARLFVWTIIPLAFFTVSIGKQPRYILPILPPIALLLADTIARRLARRPEGRDGLLQIPAGVIALLLSIMTVLLYRARPLIIMVPTVFVFAAIVSMAAAAGVAFSVALAPRARMVPAGIALAGALMIGGLQYGLSPGGRDPVQDMAMLVTQHRGNSESVATFRVFVRNLVFYTGIRQADLPSEQAAIDFLRSRERVLCVIEADDLARLQQIAKLETRILGEVVYFNASAVRLRTLIDPDESRDLERVLLVTNH
jgi:4-amino-4-deoxy-L-arabinose transferase-like glycosyltransferase